MSDLVLRNGEEKKHKIAEANFAHCKSFVHIHCVDTDWLRPRMLKLTKEGKRKLWSIDT